MTVFDYRVMCVVFFFQVIDDIRIFYFLVQWVKYTDSRIRSIFYDHQYMLLLRMPDSTLGRGITQTFHYENTPMLYTAIFQGCRNDNFHMKQCDISRFLLKTKLVVFV